MVPQHGMMAANTLVNNLNCTRRATANGDRVFVVQWIYHAGFGAGLYDQPCHRRVPFYACGIGEIKKKIALPWQASGKNDRLCYFVWKKPWPCLPASEAGTL
jgi:hypothetical protein